MKFTVKDNFTAKAAAMIADRSNKAEHIVALQARSDTSPYVPFLTGSLDQRTRVVGNTIIYPGPYAHYLYVGLLKVDPETGSAWARQGVTKVLTSTPLKYTGRDRPFERGGHALAGPKWFERSKAQNKEKWLDLAQEVMNHG